MSFDVAIVAQERDGLDALGKVEGKLFWPAFARELEVYGVRPRIYAGSGDFLNETTRSERLVLLNVINESCILGQAPQDELARVRAHAQALSGRLLVCNEPDAGLILGNKRRANQMLSMMGVPMPRLILEGGTGKQVFSNDLVGSGATVAMSEEVDPDRYNTEFIDTTQEFEGRKYFICLRAMCIGPVMYALMLRARDQDAADASVHTSNTPADPRLLNYLYAKVVGPRQEAIAALCGRLGSALGFGFYAHDILPPSGGRNVMICESGFKYDEFSIRAYLGHVGPQMIANEHMTPHIFKHAALTFLAESERLLAA